MVDSINIVLLFLNVISVSYVPIDQILKINVCILILLRCEARSGGCAQPSITYGMCEHQ